MSRKKDHNHDYIPKVGDVKPIASLPREIRLAIKDNTLEEGWDETTATRQLWRIWGNPQEKLATFVGYIVPEAPDKRPRG